MDNTPVVDWIKHFRTSWYIFERGSNHYLNFPDNSWNNLSDIFVKIVWVFFESISYKHKNIVFCCTFEYEHFIVTNSYNNNQWLHKLTKNYLIFVSQNEIHVWANLYLIPTYRGWKNTLSESQWIFWYNFYGNRSCSNFWY